MKTQSSIVQDINVVDSILLESPASCIINPNTTSIKEIRTEVKLKGYGYLIKPGQNYSIDIQLDKQLLSKSKTCLFVPDNKMIRLGVAITSTIGVNDDEAVLTVFCVNTNQQHSVRVLANDHLGQLLFS